MYLIVIAWLYVVLMMAVAEAFSTQGSVLGAVITFLLYGVLPLSLLIYILNTPQRKARRKAEEALLNTGVGSESMATAPDVSMVEPDAGGHAPGGAQDAAVPAVGKKH